MSKKKNSGNGQHPPESDLPEMVDLSALLSRISDSLITLDTVEMPTQEPTPTPSSPLPDITPEAAIIPLRYLIVALDKDTYGFSTEHVEEVMIEPLITPVPGLPDWVVGVTNVHGDVASVIHLKKFLGETDATWDRQKPVVLTHANDQRIALLVDNVQSIHTFPAEEIFSPPYKIATELVPYLQGIIRHEDKVIHLLDCESLLTGEAMQQFA